MWFATARSGRPSAWKSATGVEDSSEKLCAAAAEGNKAATSRNATAATKRHSRPRMRASARLAQQGRVSVVRVEALVIPNVLAIASEIPRRRRHAVVQQCRYQGTMLSNAGHRHCPH